MDHYYREQYKSDCISESTSGLVPYHTQKSITLCITQEHEVLVKYCVYAVHNSYKNKDLANT